MTINTVAVLGAGTMGRGIAHVAALGGFETRLYDVDTGRSSGPWRRPPQPRQGRRRWARWTRPPRTAHARR